MPCFPSNLISLNHNAPVPICQRERIWSHSVKSNKDWVFTGAKNMKNHFISYILPVICTSLYRGGGHLPNFCMRVCQHSLRNFTLSVAIFLLRFWWKTYPRCWHTRGTLYIGSLPPGTLYHFYSLISVMYFDVLFQRATCRSTENLLAALREKSDAKKAPSLEPFHGV